MYTIEQFTENSEMLISVIVYCQPTVSTPRVKLGVLTVVGPLATYPQPPARRGQSPRAPHVFFIFPQSPPLLNMSIWRQVALLRAFLFVQQKRKVEKCELKVNTFGKSEPHRFSQSVR